MWRPNTKVTTMETHAETTASERAKHIRQANANQAIEGFHPDEADKEVQASYIAGTASLADMFMHAQKFADEARNT